MKGLLLAVTLLSTTAFAEDISVKCTMTEFKHIAQFELDATFDTDSAEFTDKELEITTRDRGNEGEENDLSLVRDGAITIYEAGTLTKYPFVRINSSDLESDVRVINILADYPGFHKSSIRLASGRVYYSTCKIEK
jgi:hypothetical protein